MPINPSIALSVEQVKLPDPVQAASNYFTLKQAKLSNAMSEAQLNQYQEDSQQKQALRNALVKTPDIVNDPQKLLMFGKPGAELAKAVLENKKGEMESTKLNVENVGNAMKNSRTLLDGVTTPQEYVSWLQGSFQDPVLGTYFKSHGVDLQSKLAETQDKLSKGQFGQLLNESKLGAEKALENVYQQQNLGGAVRTISMPKYGKPTAIGVPGSYAQVTPSPNAPKTVINNVQKNEAEFGKQVAGSQAKSFVTLQEKAQSAVENLNNTHKLQDILDSGKIFTGSLANVKLAFAKAANLIGENDSESIKNTEIYLQNGAKYVAENARASGLGAGNGFSDRDAKLLEKVAGGSITDDPKTLKDILDTMNRVNENIIKRYNSRLKEVSPLLQGTGTSPVPITPPVRAAKPAAISQDVWDNMTPEQKKLFKK